MDFEVAAWVNDKIGLLARMWGWHRDRAAFQVMCDIDDDVSDCPRKHERAAMEALVQIYMDAREARRAK